jgi:dihydroorotate dehydrogenase electron transfer subunit
MSVILCKSATVVENVRMARATYRIRLAAPEIARAILPGQFIMLRFPATNDPLLGRPFALYDTVIDEHGHPIGLDIVYLVVGKVTGLLAEARPGSELIVWGPLGNRFPLPNAKTRHAGSVPPQGRVTLVAGGIGQTPFLAYGRELLGGRGYGGAAAKRAAADVEMCYGIRSADLAAGVDDFRAAGMEVHLASDDGSIGHRGFVTELVKRCARPDHLVGCGPEPMLRSLAKLAGQMDVPCHLSLETPMACGIGICFSCVTRVRTPDGWDYRRVCTDGPIFDAADLACEDA